MGGVCNIGSCIIGVCGAGDFTRTGFKRAIMLAVHDSSHIETANGVFRSARKWI